MDGVDVSHLKYINVLLLYSVKILDIKSSWFRGTHNNKIYITIVDEFVNCSSIQAFHKTYFTNYKFDNLFIYLY